MLETDAEVSFAEDEEDAAQEKRQLAAEVLRTLKASQQVLKRYAAVPQASRTDAMDSKMLTQIIELVTVVRDLYIPLKNDELTKGGHADPTEQAKLDWNAAVRVA